nr:unnamed protein product [Callosobruchus chinensis]
MLHIQKTGH